MPTTRTFHLTWNDTPHCNFVAHAQRAFLWTWVEGRPAPDDFRRDIWNITGNSLITAPVNSVNAASERKLAEELFLLRRIEAVNRKIRLDPKDARAYLDRAYALYRLNRFDEALQSYDEAIRFDPSSAAAYFERGVVLDHLNRFDEALQSYDEAIRLYPPYAQILAKVRKKAYTKALPSENINGDAELEQGLSNLVNKFGFDAVATWIVGQASPDDRALLTGMVHAAHQTAVPTLPDAPLRDFQSGKEHIVDYIRSPDGLGPWLEAGVLTRPLMRKIARKAYNALSVWIQNNTLPPDIHIPTKSELLAAAANNLTSSPDAAQTIRAVSRVALRLRRLAARNP